MGNKLLIRAYNVGCGDCIYVRIPDGKDGFHILIDCGKKGGVEMLEVAIKHLEANQLPTDKATGKKRLDLLLATHRHEDHIKGFDREWFKNILVKNVWMSVAMDPSNKQAEKVKGLHAFATEKMRGIAASGQAMSPEVEMLASLYSVGNDQADKFLFECKPKFVHSGMTGKNLGLPADTAIHVLAPEQDIDHYYLGEEIDKSLKGLNGPGGSFAKPPESGEGPAPKNISATDFSILQSRMLSNALAFVAKDTSIQNNLSVVLLLEWKKRRLLFVGDAEWEREFQDGKHNGSWNVMWEKHHKTHLSSPLDFLKIGHHGSTNATPHPAEWRNSKKKPTASPSVWEILDVLLPVPKKGQKPTAQAIVSTEREFYDPIPECKLMVDLARRVRNTRTYGTDLKAKKINVQSIWVTAKAKKNKFFERYEKDFLNQPQPLRTDLECMLTQQGYIDVEIEPK
jgi:beta-lactamase superfamily II metal-dependent hydrolase